VGDDLAWLDSYAGVYGWQSSFNLVILRIVSFNMDLHWARLAQSSKSEDSTAASVTETKRKPRSAYEVLVESHRPMGEYASAVSFLGYCFYIPLYLSGPTLSFNAFAAQVCSTQRAYSPREVVVYALSLFKNLVLFEGLLHYYHCFGAVSSGAYANLTASEIGSLGFIALTCIWLKFLVIWRFARLWALCDGIETIENMNRCMHNNYSVSGFWRSWHQSFNKWLIRYLYIPLGGRKYRALATVVVFTFVALWHDVQWKLLTWGLGCAGFIIVEKALQDAGRTHMDVLGGLYRLACACAGAFCIYALMLINLIGYSTGIGGMEAFLERFAGDPIFLVCGYAFFFACTQVMFEIREAEARGGDLTQIGT